MPHCLFCKRDDVPRIPLLPIAINALVAHVAPDGEPCLEGTSQEAHSTMIVDYPHDELMDDDTAWDLAITPSIGPLRTLSEEIHDQTTGALMIDVHVRDPIDTAARAFAAEDGEPRAPAELAAEQPVQVQERPRRARKPRTRPEQV